MRRSLAAFTERYLGHKPARHHLLLIDKLEAVERGDIRRLMVFMPPGSAKSTYVSHAFPAWCFGRDPKRQIIAASHTIDLAANFGRRVRNTVDHHEYGLVFGVSLAGDRQAVDDWETTNGGGYKAVGFNGNITGRRADIIIIDDPIKGREDADSETIREKTFEAYRADLFNRRKPGYRIVLIQTRWHEDDLAGRLLPEDYAGESGPLQCRDGRVWEVVNIPMIARENDPLGRTAGETLWPEYFDADFLNGLVEFQGPRNWSALFQQTPAPDSGDFFKREWMKPYDRLPADTLRIYGASDYAVTADGGDYTVHVVVGVDHLDNIYLMDWWRGQTTSDQWVEMLFRFAKQYQPSMWVEERGQIEKSVGPFIDKRMQEEKFYFYRKSLTSSADKPTRAQSIRARMAQGKVLFPASAHWLPELQRELLSFPVGKHDDQVDALGLIGRVLDEMTKGKAYMDPAKQEPPRSTPLTFNEALKLNRRPDMGVRIR